MEEAPPSSPQTDRFLFWAALLTFIAVACLVYSSVRDDEARLAGLRKMEADREAELAAAEKACDQATRLVHRFSGDPEFVRDQARERLGLASPEEIVIRVETAPGRAPAPLFAPAPAGETAR